jgi:16S rRNA (uracil1498-N3)-methyltransferase
MPAERFFVDTPLQDVVTLEGTELHHLAHVMRIRVGEEVELVNGKGSLAKAKLLTLSKREATLEILQATHHPVPTEKYILAIPMMRPAKLELIIEKCTELGADAFWIYPAAHSEKENFSENQQQRLSHIAISAMKQCGRLDLPKIKILTRFDELFLPSYNYFFGDTNPDAPWITPQDRGVFITGPESGFSEKERKILQARASGVHLHKNILRAETAPIAALLLYQKISI